MIKICILKNAFGKTLRKRRLAKNYTQELLSVRAGLSRSHISQLEMGRKDPTLHTIFKLAWILGIKPSVLIDEVEHTL